MQAAAATSGRKALTGGDAVWVRLCLMYDYSKSITEQK
jgi:hypothetical protein